MKQKDKINWKYTILANFGLLGVPIMIIGVFTLLLGISSTSLQRVHWQQFVLLP
jgi:hypothetical protein